jgi:hypothetical protein
MRFWLVTVSALLASCGGGEPKTTPPAGQDVPPRTTPATKSVDPAQSGAIRGRVRIEGTPAAAAPIAMQADAWCKGHHEKPPVDESLLAVDGQLQNAFVWIEAGLEDYRFETPVEKKELDQAGCIFGPRVSGVMVGQALTALNSDPVLHNVHSKPKLNSGRNIALPRIGAARDFVFDKPEVMIPIVCDVHPWMRAFIGVVAHPYYAVSGADGSFALDGVPAGEFSLAIWHETLGIQRRSITVAAQSTLELDDFVYQLP